MFEKDLLSATMNLLVGLAVLMSIVASMGGNAGTQTVAVAMLANLLVSELNETLIPLGLLRSGVDPALASSVFLKTITDVIGFLVLLSLAALYLIQVDVFRSEAG